MTDAVPHSSALADTGPLRLTQHAGIATIEFHRPHALNALDVPMAQAFLQAMRTIAHDGGVRCVVMRGAGRAFVAGGDLATLHADPVQGARDLLAPLNEAVALMHQLDAPIIAQVHGAAAGAGLSLMLLCDLVLAAEGTQFNLAYIHLGTSCDLGASWALPRLVGLRHALEIALLSEPLTCADALRWGLINRAVPAAQLASDVQALAERIARGPTRAYGHMRRLLRGSLERDLPAQLQAEAAAFDACAHTADLAEGLAAFLGKRKAVFTGQ